MLRVGIVGCGTGGPAAALLLARAGHQVEVLERAPDPGPVGAGILLQPTGMAVLRSLGLLDDVLPQGARVERLRGVTTAGRHVLDLAYSDLEPGLFGLGIHRGALFSVLRAALAAAGVPVRCGVDVTAIDRRGSLVTLRDAAGNGHGPFDLVVGADGARSAVRAAMAMPGRVRPYPWGALWAILSDPNGAHDGVLAQRYRGTRAMLGYLPLGASPAVAGGARLVSLFWSVRGADVAALRAGGVDAWRHSVLALAPDAGPVLAHIMSLDALLYAGYHDVRLHRSGEGALVLIGDAAHAMSPQLGQGANLALLDAWVLAEALARESSTARALAAYDESRRAHIRFYAWASRLLTPVFQSSLSPVAMPRDLLAGPAGRVPWLRRQMLASLAGTKTGILASLNVPGLGPLDGRP